MKKYIRTFNNIYAASKEMEIKTFYFSVGDKGTPHLIYDDHLTRMDFLGPVVSQADSLEELVDCYIGELATGKKVFLERWGGNELVIHWETHMVYNVKELNKTFLNVKGAIYTDKGLKYVTRLNDKGDLVL